MYNMKKFLSLMMAFMMLFTMMPVQTLAETISSPWSVGVSTLAISGAREVAVGDTIKLTGSSGFSHSWTAKGEGEVTIGNGNAQSADITGVTAGKVTITHTYYNSKGNQKSETYDITVTAPTLTTQTVYVYVQASNTNLLPEGMAENKDGWYTIGTIKLDALPNAASWHKTDGKNYIKSVTDAALRSALADIVRYSDSSDSVQSEATRLFMEYGLLDLADWRADENGTNFGLYGSNGATGYNAAHGLSGQVVWHLDGYIDFSKISPTVTVKHIAKEADGSERLLAAETKGVNYKEIYQVADWQLSADDERLEAGYVYSSVSDEQLVINYIVDTVTIYYTPKAFDYAIEYYYNNELDETATEKGTDSCGSIIKNYKEKPKEGYVFDKVENCPLTITADEPNNVMKVYYKKNAFNVTYFVDGVQNGEVESHDFNTEVTLHDKPTKTGYKFVGWDVQTPAGLSIKSNKFTMPAQDVELIGHFEKDETQTQLTNYTVHYTIEGVEQADDRVTVNGTAWINDDPAQIAIAEGGIPAPADKYEGYKLDSANPEYPAAGTLVNSGSEYTVNYVKRTDLSYTVKYLEQGTNKPLADEKTVDSQTFGDTVTEKAIDITGYTAVEPTSQTITIAVDGNEIKFYYTINSHKVTYQYEGTVPAGASELPEKASYNYNTAVTVAPDATAPGYTFSGWTTKDATVADGKFTMPDNDVVLVGSFTENAKVTIKYEAAVGGSVSPTSESLAPATGEAQGSTATAAAGYEFVNWTLNGAEVSTSASFVPQKFDDKDSPIWTERTYVANFKELPDVTINYVAGNGGSVSLDEETLPPATSKAQGSVATAKDGYTFVNWTNAAGEVVGKDKAYVPAKVDGLNVAATYTANFVPNADTQYKVEYYWENVDDSNFTLHETVNLTGETDTEAVAEQKIYEGFTFDSGNTNNVFTGTIAGDGSLVLKLYYTRNTYKVTYTYSNTPEGASALPAEATYKFGVDVLVASKAMAPGYTFHGWTADDASVAGDKFTMPAKDVALTGSFTRNYATYDFGVTPYEGVYDAVAHGVTLVRDTALAEDAVQYSVDGQNWGNEAPAYTDVKRNDAGEVESYPVWVRLYNSSDNSVSAAKESYVKITPATLKVTTPNANKVYDGTALTAAGTITGFVHDETATFATTGNQTKVGSSQNTYVITWNGNAKESNYTVAETVGTLTVTEYADEITVTTTGGSFTYNGQPHGATVSVSELPKGYTLEIATSSATATDVTTAAVLATCDTLVIKNAEGENVTSKLNIKKVDGSIVVIPAAITVYAEDSRVYTGENQTLDIGAFEGKIVTGVVDDETLTLTDATITGNAAGEYTKLDTETYNNWSVAKADGTDSTGNYTIEVTGKLTITQQDNLAVTLADQEYVYDGTAHFLKAAEVTSAGGETTLEYSIDQKTWYDSVEDVALGLTDVGEVTIYVQAINPNYSNTAVDSAVLKVTPKDVTITAQNHQFDYTGEEQSWAEYDVDGLVGSDKLSATVAGRIQYPVQSPVANVVTAHEFVTGNPNNYTVEYATGTLTMVWGEKAAITIKAADDAWTYNGEAHSNDAVSIIEGALQTGDVLVAQATGSVTNVADSKTGNNPVAEGYQIMNGTEDVTDKYEITAEAGTLTINKRAVTLTSATDSKPYDGTALTNDTVTVGGDGFVTGEGATYDVTGTQTDVGNSANAFTYTLNDNTVADNYNITKTEGQLTVAPITDEVIVTITGNMKTSPYTGADQTVTGYTATASNSLYIVEGENCDFAFTGKAEAIRKDVGTTNMGLTAEQFSNADTTNFTNVKFVVNDGWLTITPIATQIIITAGSDKKVYDGDPLTSDVFTYTPNVLRKGDVLQVTTAGEQTNVGTAANQVTSYKVVRGEGENQVDVTANYSFGESVDGTLEVTPRSVTITVNDAEKFFGENDPAFTGTVEGLVNDNDLGTVTYTRTNTDEAVGTYPDALTANFTPNGNYDVTVDNGDFTIKTATAAGATLKAQGGSWPYDGNPHAASAAVSGAEGFTIYYKVGEAEWTTEAPFVTNVSEGTVTVQVKATKIGYNDLICGDVMLQITPRPIAIIAASDKKVYDGTALSNGQYAVVDGHVNAAPTDAVFNVDGRAVIGQETITATVTGSRMDVGISDNTAADAKVIGDLGNYDVKYVKGTLEVTKRPVILTSATDSKTYDGTALTNHTVTVGGEGFVGDEGATYDVTGSQTLEGESLNTFTYTLKEGTKAENYDITKIEGTLKIYPIADKVTVTIKGNVVSTIYDGMEHKAIGYDVVSISNELYGAENIKFNGTSEVAGTDAKKYPMGLAAGQFENTSKNFTNVEFVVEDGSLTIDKRPVTFVGESGECTYNGSEYDLIVVTVDETQGQALVAGHQANVTASAKGMLPGTYPGAITAEADVRITDANGQDVTGNYDITTVPGTLTITAIATPITITAADGTKMYNGSALTNAGYTFTEGVLLEGDKLEAVVEGSATNVSDAGVNTVTSHKVMRGDVDVTKAYTFGAPVDGKLTITPRKVTMTSGDAEKSYDGKPLTNGTVTETGDGFVSGEGADYNVTGSQTLAGSSKNTFTYALKAGTLAENYVIDTVEGDLTVTANTTELKITSGTETWVYDGQPHSHPVYIVTYDGKAVTPNADGTFTLSTGDTLTISGAPVVTDVADTQDAKENNTFGYVLTNAEQYTKVETEVGTVTVARRPVTIQVNTKPHVYDGTEKTVTDEATKQEYTVAAPEENSGLLNGDTEKLDVVYGTDQAQSKVLVGTYAAAVSAEGVKILRSADNADVTDNYAVAVNNGMLDINDGTTETPVDQYVVTKAHTGNGYNLGETVTFDITATNIYNETKTITLREIEGVTLAQSVFTDVPAGETVRTTATYTITEADILAGEFVNTVTATFDVKSFQSTDTVTTAATNAHLTITKTTISTPANGTAYALGETITYDITVNNDGNVTISNIEVMDTVAGYEPVMLTEGENAFTLVPGAAQPIRYTHVVTEQDILAGTVVNTATATGTSPANVPLPEVVPGSVEDDIEAPNPSFTLEKTLTNLPDKGYFTLGEEAAFDISVTNDGNLTLSGINVYEQLEGAVILEGEGYTVSDDVATIVTLPVGDTVVVKAAYTITEADLGAELVNIATADGTGPVDPEDPTPGEEEIPTDDAVTVTGIKTWNDGGNAYATRPDAITVNLLADGAEVAEQLVTADMGWVYTFTALPAHTADGAEIVYTVAEDAVAGYDAAYAEGSIVNTLQTYGVTVNYWLNNVGGTPAADSFYGTYQYGQPFNIASPAVLGYNVNQERVTGTVLGDVTFDVIYTPAAFTIAVHYVYQDGTEALATYRDTLLYGEGFYVATPALAGYTPNIRMIAGNMEARHMSYTVIYAPEDTVITIDEYGVPLGLGNMVMNVGDCIE